MRKRYMCSLWTALCLFMLAPHLKAQTNDPWNQQVDMHTDDLPTLPMHYQQRLAMFERQPLHPVHLLFLGNSITEMGHWRALTQDSTALNRGIGGDVTAGILKRLAEVVRWHPDKLFLLIGINDLGKGVSVDTVAARYDRILAELHRQLPHTRVYVESVLPVNPGVARFPKAYNVNAEVLRLNPMLKKLAHRYHDQWVNIHDTFRDSDGLLIASYTLEGLHLNPSGYAHWIAYLKAHHDL